MNVKRLAAALACGILTLGGMQTLPAGAASLRTTDALRMQAPRVSETVSLPVQYDLRKLGLTTRVQRQGSYGMCWSFASLASLESTVIAGDPAVDFSEWNLAYYTYSPVFGFPLAGADTKEQVLRTGGNFYVVAPMLTGWLGPVAEASAPFGDPDVLDPDLTADALRSRSVYHVTDAEMYLYDAESQVTEDMYTAVKQSVYGGHAVALSFYNLPSAHDLSNFTYYNAGNVRTGGNYHAVTVVGWDDAFPAERFGRDPGRDGAFLCKNSWGPTWGDGGYFWISYAEPSIVELYTVRGEDAQKHTGQYQYDSYGFWTAMSEGDAETSDYMANLFTAQEDTCISAVMFATAMENESYSIRVYRDVQDPADPTSGTASARTRGTVQTMGYHTVTLDEPVFVKAGERFSVSVHLSGAAGQHITCEAYMRFTTEHADGTTEVSESLLTEEAIQRDFHAGESFYSTDGKNWHDLYDEETIDETVTDPATGVSESVYGKAGNVCVRALTQEIGRVVYSDYAQAVPEGTQIALSCPGAQEIWYSVNGLEFGLYTEPVTITQETNLYAYAVLDGVQYPTECRHYRVRTAQLSSLLRTDTGEYLEFTQQSDTLWTAVCPGVQTMTLLPITTAEIRSASGDFSSGERTTVTETGAVTLVTQEAHMLDGTYVVYLTDCIRGNVNLDAQVDAADATEVLIYAAQCGAGAEPEQDEAWRSRADCDENGSINAADATWILQYAAERGAG